MKNYIGLTTQEAQSLLMRNGLNFLPSKNKVSVIKLIISQFKSLLVAILLLAALLSFFIGDRIDGALILLILVFNALLGFYQEYKASKEIESLRALEVASVRVIRDGKEGLMSAQFLVVGDLVRVEAGDKIPADGKLVEEFDLFVNEASLTGESLPVLKTVKSGEDRLFLGSAVTSGRGLLEITQTGQATKLGILALKLSTIEDEKTPLERSIQVMAQVLAFCAISLAGVILVLHILNDQPFFEAFFLATSVAVAAVPEGLPVITTILLALGARNMYKKQALVRKMVAIENLGAVTLICTDKTGTLTKNEMRVVEVESASGKKDALLKCAVLCNSASLVLKDDGSFDLLGDSTEGALLFWAKDQGVDVDSLRRLGKIIDEEPFNIASRKMQVTWQEDKKQTVYIKGAPDKLLSGKKEWEERYYRMTKQGLRVLAFLEGSEFLGLIGISDPPREEVKLALDRAKKAGIKTVMVTGDNELTAAFIAKEVGLLGAEQEVITGAQLDLLSDEELLLRMDKIAVYARCVPEQKLRIVTLYQQSGEIVAVTGDGVNDALALKQAEVGVAMGKIGTTVAKEASDIVLLNDDFSTIIAAVEEGRVIYSNILKVTKFLITGNLSEVLVILIAGALFLPSPLLPVQILWINLVSDGILALALAFDHEGRSLMKSSPRKLSSNFFDIRTYFNIISGGILIAVVTFNLYLLGLKISGIEAARAMAFTSNVILQIGLMLYIRRRSSITSNRYLLIAVLAVVTAQALILLVPELRGIFKIN